MLTREEFVAQIRAAIEECWKKEPASHKTLESAVIWTSCYFQAKQMHDDYMIKDWAELLQNGIRPINTEKIALELWSDVFDGYELNEIGKALEDEKATIRKFWLPNG